MIAVGDITHLKLRDWNLALQKNFSHLQKALDKFAAKKQAVCLGAVPERRNRQNELVGLRVVADSIAIGDHCTKAQINIVHCRNLDVEGKLVISSQN